MENQRKEKWKTIRINATMTTIKKTETIFFVIDTLESGKLKNGMTCKIQEVKKRYWNRLKDHKCLEYFLLTQSICT